MIEIGADAPALAISIVAEGPHWRLDRNPAAASPANHPPENQDAVTEVTVLVGNQAVVLPRLVQASPVRADALTPPEDLSLDGAQRWEPLEVGCRRLHEEVDVALVEGGHDPFRDLHVLLRHRLVLQAEVGEGAAAIKVDDESRHLAVADM